MRVLRQFGIIIGIWMVGEAVNKLLHLVIPGSIIGMLLLLFLMQSEIIKESDIKEISDFLLGNLAFFFIPAGVALITIGGVLKNTWWKIAIVVAVTTIIVTVATGHTVQKMIRKKVRK